MKFRHAESDAQSRGYFCEHDPKRRREETALCLEGEFARFSTWQME